MSFFGFWQRLILLITRGKTRDLYKAQWERNNLDITMKNKELIEKIHEVDNLRRRYEDALGRLPPDYSQSKITVMID